MEPSTEERNFENQPLLVSEKQPLSRVQLALLCFLRLLDPLSFTQIFPYINEFMKDLNVTTDPSKIGFYSGLVVSVLLLSESAMCSYTIVGELVRRLPTHVDISMGFYVWYNYPYFLKNNLTQRLDMIGRRPVILAGTVGLALSTILFGLSQNFQSALAARALGTTNGL